MLILLTIQPIYAENVNDNSNVISTSQLKLADWTTPSLIAQFNNSEYIDRIIANEHTLFALNNNSELMLFDISTPNEVDYMYRENSFLYKNFILEGNLLYLTHETGIAIFDVTQRNNIQFLGGDSIYINPVIHQGITGIAIHNQVLFVGTMNNGIIVMNVTNPNSPFIVGTYLDGPFGSYNVMEIQNSILYVGDRSVDQLKVINITDPTLPVLITSMYVGQVQSGPNSMSIRSNTIYLTLDNYGYEIIDITDPSDPYRILNYNAGSPLAIDTIDNFAVISDGNDGIIITDLSDPESMQYYITIYDQNNPSYDLYITRDLIYAATGEDGIKVIDYGRDDDSDGLTNGAEKYIHFTDLEDSDSDNDGMLDGQEIADGFDPLKPDGSNITITTTNNRSDSDFRDLGYIVLILLIIGAIFLFQKRAFSRNEPFFPDVPNKTKLSNQQNETIVENVQSGINAQSQLCPSCGTLNPSGSSYCIQCGLYID